MCAAAAMPKMAGAVPNTGMVLTRKLGTIWQAAAQQSTAKHSKAQQSTAQQSTAKHSKAQQSTAKHSPISST
jgi:hypothetical protein